MIIIYDFDGTLTPYSLPQYPVLKQFGVTDQSLMARIEEELHKGQVSSFYEAYYKCYKNILHENGVTMSRRNICLGANNVQFNKDVVDYFNRFQCSKTGIKHYIVTSGVQDFVEETAISSYVDGIYGVTFKQENGIFQNVDTLLSDKKKVDVIKELQSKNKGTRDVIYFGDGLTDKFAFAYVHSIGGKNVFVASNEHSINSYKKLNENGIINECFKADFAINSSISNYVAKQISRQQDDDLSL